MSRRPASATATCSSALEAGGWSLGGEQSGHVIFRDLATTGDGVLTGLQLLDVVHRTGTPLARSRAAAMTRLPAGAAQRPGARPWQVSIKRLPSGTPSKLAESELGDTGRVLIRSSGTEPLVRVMVEALTQEVADTVCERLCSVVADSLGTA